MLFEHYVLDADGNPQPEHDRTRWREWFETADRILKQDWIGSVWVSTVFLGIDHNWFEIPPLLWESMAVSDGEVLEQDRYSTRPEALAGHEAMAARVRKMQERMIEERRITEEL